MLTIRIKGRPTLGNLQGPYEASIPNRGTWRSYSYELDQITKYFGPDKAPDDVFRNDVANFKAYLEEHSGYSQRHIDQAITIGSSFWLWMMDMGFATVNPFYKMRGIKEKQIEVLVV